MRQSKAGVRSRRPVKRLQHPRRRPEEPVHRRDISFPRRLRPGRDRVVISVRQHRRSPFVGCRIGMGKGVGSRGHGRSDRDPGQRARHPGRGPRISRTERRSSPVSQPPSSPRKRGSPAHPQTGARLRGHDENPRKDLTITRAPLCPNPLPGIKAQSAAGLRPPVPRVGARMTFAEWLGWSAPVSP